MQHFAMENTVYQTIFLTLILAYYTFENKSSNTGEYQPDELDDNLIENNHEECSYPPKN